MLHLSIYHLAYCCALLLCSMDQSRRSAWSSAGEGRPIGGAEAVTIIIDGATTNEWATRDEYQRLIEQQKRLQQRERDELAELADLTQQFILPEESVDQAAGARTLADYTQTAAENEQQTALAAPLGASFQPEAGPLDTLDALEALGAAEAEAAAISRKLLRRGTVPKKYCGHKLMEVLEALCEARFFDGKDAKVAQPIVRTRRSPADADGQRTGGVARRRKLRTLDNNNNNNSNDNNNSSNQDEDGQHPQPTISNPETFWRQFYDGTGLNNNNNQQPSSNHNQRQQYLSSLASQQQQQQQLAPLSANRQHHSSASNGGGGGGILSGNSVNMNNDNLLDISGNLNNLSGAKSPLDSLDIGTRVDGATATPIARANGKQFERVPSSRKAQLRRIRGAHTECCLQACDAEQLMTFCAQKPTK